EAALQIAVSQNGDGGAMTYRTSKLPQRPASKTTSRTTGTGTRDRPVTLSVNVADGRRHHGLPKCYAITSVAEALDVSTRTVRRWIANGDLVVHRVNGVIRVAEADLRAFLALHREG